MKKVVSALTAAAMCASMAASVVSVFAYSSDEIGFYLKVNSTGDYTVSEDGKTITFASAADAAGAKFMVGQYIDADPSKVAIQQIGAMVEASSTSVHLPEAGAALDAEGYYSEAKSYTIPASDLTGGTEYTFETDCFINCFGAAKKQGKKYVYDNACSNISYNHSSKYPASFNYTADEERLNWIWMYNFNVKLFPGDNTAADYEGKRSAHFLLGDKSDTYPLTEFEVTLDSAIKEGSYSIDFVEMYTNEYGETEATFVNSGESGSKPVIPGTLEGLTIVVGEAGDQPTEPSTEPTQNDTDPTQDDTGSDPGTADGFTWSIDKGVVVEDGYAEINVYVSNDSGTGAYAFQMLINGKEFSEYGITIDDIAKGKAYELMDTFQPNTGIGYAGAASTLTAENQFAKEGTPVVTYYLTIPDDMAEGEYELTFNDFKVGDADGKEIKPTLVAGSLIVGDVEPTEPQPTETEPTPTETEPTPTETEPTPTETEPKPTETEPGDDDYLYGDVNKNGKVELVDIVLLNRHLTGYEDQKLDDYQTEVADCYDNGKLTGADSLEILKYLIGNIKSLPTAAK